MMDPNSAHQTWSLWTAVIDVPFHAAHVTPLFESEMKRASALFYRKLFGSAGEMRITRDTNGVTTTFTVKCRVEGPPVQERAFRKRRMDQIAQFFGRALRVYGKVHVLVDVKIEAGDPGTGKPASQLILAPPLS